jgi:hypothetical protein
VLHVSHFNFTTFTVVIRVLVTAHSYELLANSLLMWFFIFSRTVQIVLTLVRLEVSKRGTNFVCRKYFKIFFWGGMDLCRYEM